MYYRLDENNNAIPCTPLEWAEQLEIKIRNHGRHIGDNTVNGKRISTIWIGMNHNWHGDSPPLLFETMIFEGDDFHYIYCQRYSTWQEAEEGHKKAVQWVLEGCHDL